ncbi:MAG: ATP-binding protein [Pseudomonadota bacterium]|nr:ATP-binding protein [Pseudomonadota bacterium]
MQAAKKQTSDELIKFIEELKDQWVQTIDALADPLMLVSQDYKVVRSNTAMAKVADMSVTEVIGKTCYEVFAKRDTPCENCTMREAINDKASKSWELQLGETYYEVTSQPFANASSQESGTVQIYHNRTEMKLLQDQVMQREKLASIGLLSSGVAHEINNPLGGILVFAQMLLKEMDKSSPHYKDVEEIEAATQRCKAIVSSLLDFAKHRGAIDQNKKSSVPLTSTIQAALSLARVAFGGSVKVIEDYEEDLQVFADRNKLIQVFLNLIQNATHAMEQGGTITLQTRLHSEHEDQKKYALISISDSGIGIPDEHIKRIFEPFFTTKEPGDGTGLGLSICYGIIKDMGGTLEVNSQINQGSTFAIKLPLKYKALSST